jgi:hypothetical protein
MESSAILKYASIETPQKRDHLTLSARFGKWALREHGRAIPREGTTKRTCHPSLLCRNQFSNLGARWNVHDSASSRSKAPDANEIGECLAQLVVSYCREQFTSWYREHSGESGVRQDYCRLIDTMAQGKTHCSIGSKQWLSLLSYFRSPIPIESSAASHSHLATPPW